MLLVAFFSSHPRGTCSTRSGPNSGSELPGELGGQVLLLPPGSLPLPSLQSQVPWRALRRTQGPPSPAPGLQGSHPPEHHLECKSDLAGRPVSLKET